MTATNVVLSERTDAAREVPVQPCEPWCREGEEHHAKQHPVDRMCRNDELAVPLSLEKAVGMTDGSFWTDVLEVYVRRDPGGDQYAVLFHEADDQEVKLTPEEALALAELLMDSARTLGVPA